MSRCYEDCKIVGDLKKLCLDKEKEISKLISENEELLEEIELLKSKLDSNESNEEVKKEEPKKNKPLPKVMGM